MAIRSGEDNRFNNLRKQSGNNTAINRARAILANPTRMIPSYADPKGASAQAANRINQVAAASGLIPGRTNLPAVQGQGGTRVNLPTTVGDTGVRQNLGTGARAENGFPISASAQSLFVDPTPIYRPILDFIEKQRGAANDRYAQNKADIANIFGTLTQVRRADAEKIQGLFDASVASQQQALATRTAAARTGAAQTMQAAQTAGAERGGGPEGNLAASPVQVAAEQGIADSNAYATIWEGMQRAIQGQTQQDLQSNLAGYGFQQVMANRDLQDNLEGTLNQLAGQEVGARTDMAEAVFGQKSKVAEANYNETLARQAAEENRRLAAIQGSYSVQRARINAQNKIQVAQINAANRVTNYGNDSLGISRRLIDSGVEPGSFWATVDSIDLTGITTPSAAYSRWRAANPRASAIAADAARDWFNAQRYERADSNSIMPGVNLGGSGSSATVTPGSATPGR